MTESTKTIPGNLSFGRLYQKWGGRYALLEVQAVAHKLYPERGTIKLAVLCQDIRIKCGNVVHVLVTPIWGEGGMWVLENRLQIVAKIPTEYRIPNTNQMFDLSKNKPTSLEDMGG